MSKPKIDRATGENKSGYSNINQNNITEFMTNKDKLLTKLVRFIDLSLDFIEVVNDLKSDYKNLSSIYKKNKKKGI